MTPNTLPPSPRGPQCPPAATLEAMSAGEDVAPAIRSHTDGCAGCSAQLVALRQAADAFNKARPPELFMKQLQRREATRRAGTRRWMPVLAFVLPLLLAVVLVPRLLQRDDGVRLKGEGFRVAVARGSGTPALLANDAVVHPGDALRFSYEADQDGHLLVLNLDGRGEASVLHPFGATRSAPLPAGQRDFLPGSVVLDDAPGPEFLVAVFSRDPLEAQPLLDSLRHQANRPEPSLGCAGCRVTTLRLQKRP